MTIQAGPVHVILECTLENFSDNCEWGGMESPSITWIFSRSLLSLQIYNSTDPIIFEENMRENLMERKDPQRIIVGIVVEMNLLFSGMGCLKSSDILTR